MRSIFTIITLLLSVSFTSVSAQAPSTKPAADPTQTKLFNELYGKSIKDALKTPSINDNVDLASQILAAAKASRTKLTFVNLATKAAYDLTHRFAAGQFIAGEALAFRAEVLPDQAADAKSKLVKLYERRYSTAPAAKKSEIGKRLIDILIDSADEHIDADNFTAATLAYNRALAVARSIDSPPTIARVQALIKNLVSRKLIQARIAALKKNLKRNPRDIKSAREITSIYLLEVNSVRRALAFASLSGDKKLVTYIASLTSSKPLPKPTDYIEMGSYFSTLASQVTSPRAKLNAHKYAASAFKTYLDSPGPNPPSLVKIRAEVGRKKSLEQIRTLEKQIANAANPENVGGDWIDMLKEVTAPAGWRKANGGLYSSFTSDAKAAFPFHCDGSYELKMKIYKSAGRAEIGVTIPIGASRATCWVIQGLRSVAGGLSSVNGKRYIDAGNPTRYARAGLSNKKTATIFVKVEINKDKVKITGTINGSKRLKFTGKVRDLSHYYSWVVYSRNKSPGVFCDYAKIKVTEAKIRPLANSKVWKTGTEKPN